MSKANKNPQLYSLLLAYTAATLFAINLPFFSDGIVQSSIAGQWFFDHNFGYFFFPETANPGHPPFWGMYLAVWWKVLGQELWVSHLAMLPFLWGIAWNYHHIARLFLKGRMLTVALLFLFFEPTLLALSTQVTPDIPLVCFFLMALRYLLYERHAWQAVAMCVLPLLNTRGTMLIAVLFLMEVAVNYSLKRPFKWRLLWKYVLAGMVMAGWLGTHYLVKGWIGYNRENMPWRSAFEPVGLMGYIRNWAILGWRFLDFGRIALWLVTGVLCFWAFFQKIKIPKQTWLLLVLAACQVLVFGLVMTRYTGTLQHRYLLPAFILFGLFSVCLLNLVQQVRLRYVLAGLMLLNLAGGHFWIYPDKVAQGWEASFAHLPYFSLQKEVLQYLDNERIAPDRVAAGTPLKYRFFDTHLQPRDQKMADHDEVEVLNYPFALYSNISNDWPDETYDLLHGEWELVNEWQKGGIVIRLFQNPDQSKIQPHN